METPARAGLGKRLAAWLVLAFVAVILFKAAVGIVAGLVMTALTIVVVVVAGFGVVWALRRL